MKAEPRGCPLIDLVCFYLDDAAQKVIKNKGAPGIDGITYEQLPNLLRVHGEKIRQKLKNGTYIPAPVRRVDIPKPNGGTRMLGIPTLLDRTIQQAIVMTIGDAFEDQFSDKSYGFREGRNCQQAVQRAQKYIEDGNRWVVEMDLSKFFDRNIYVKSEKAAQRVLTNITKYVEETLKLRVNRDKSGTFRPRDSVFLGYTFSKADCTRIVVAQKSVKRLWAKLHKIFYTARGTSLGWTIKAITPILRGWRNYYRLDDRKQYWEEMDQRIRHHLRKLIWIAWKKSKTRERNLVKLGIDPERAWKSSGNGRGAWWNSGQSHMNQAIKNDRFVRLGLYSLLFMEIR